MLSGEPVSGAVSALAWGFFCAWRVLGSAAVRALAVDDPDSADINDSLEPQSTEYIDSDAGDGGADPRGGGGDMSAACLGTAGRVGVCGTGSLPLAAALGALEGAARGAGRVAAVALRDFAGPAGSMGTGRDVDANGRTALAGVRDSAFGVDGALAVSGDGGGLLGSPCSGSGDAGLGVLVPWPCEGPRASGADISADVAYRDRRCVSTPSGNDVGGGPPVPTSMPGRH